MPIAIRPADAARDAAAVAAIYADHTLHGTGTFEEVPPDAAEMAGRIGAVVGRGWPWLVAEDAGRIVGYAYAAQFRERSAYRFACEDSVYVRPDAGGRGIGRQLLAALIAASAAAGFRRMIAVIGDAGNVASIRVHAALGFTDAGVLHAVGDKFGRPLDVVLMERALD